MFRMPAIAGVILAFLGTLCAVARCEGDPGERYARLAAPSGVGTMQRTAYEQLARLHAVDSTESPQTESTLPVHSEVSVFTDPRKPAIILTKLGLDVLPLLAEALDDQTPTKTITYNEHFIFERVDRKVWKVNELVALVICRVVGRSFVVSRGADQFSIRTIGEHPDLAPEFKRVVLDWYAKNGKKTLAQREVEAVNDEDIANRLAAIEWIGIHKEDSGKEALLSRVDILLFPENRDFFGNSELVACALALGRLGDRGDVDRVRRICQHVSSRQWVYLPAWLQYVADAYHGLALLGEKEEAVREFNGVYDTWRSGREIPASEQRSYEELLERAKKW